MSADIFGDYIPPGHACQVCGQDDIGCWCPRFAGETHMECVKCGALQGQHLLAVDDGPPVCPPVRERTS